MLDEIPEYNYRIDQLSEQSEGFVQSDWQVGPRWTVLVGLRANWHNMVDRAVLTPRLGLMHRFAENAKLRLSYARGFRAPQAFDTDLHIAFAGGGISTIQIDPELKPEFSNSYTTSFDFDRYRRTTAYGFTLSAFYTRLYDVFILEEMNTDANGNLRLEKRNGASSTVAGLTAELRAKKGGLAELNAGLTWQESVYGQLVEWSADIPGSRQFLRTPDVYGFYSFTIRPDSDLKGYVTGVYTGSMPVPHFSGAPGVDGDRLSTSPSFLETNLKLSYTFRLKALNSRLELNGGVQNVFDAYQSDFDRGPDRDSNYVYGPARPRTFFAGLKFEM